MTTACAITAGEAGSVAVALDIIGDCSVSVAQGAAAILAAPAAVSPTVCSVEDTAREYDRSSKQSMGSHKVAG